MAMQAHITAWFTVVNIRNPALRNAMQPIAKMHACRQEVAEKRLQKISSTVMQQRKKNLENKYVFKK